MKLGIDASNIRGGGGVTHLVELLRAADPGASGFSEVVVWGGKKTLDALEPRPWLEKAHVGNLDRNLFARSFWQRFSLSGCAREAGCDLLFIPGGSFAGDFSPVVTLSQNLLPFELNELKRFGFSFMALKLLILRFVQSRTFMKASGLLFLTRYAEKAVLKVIRHTYAKTAIVPHGIEPRFLMAPRSQRPIGECSREHPFSLVYVSIIDVYKHQDQVAEAVARLRAEGLPVAVSFIGPAYSPEKRRLEKLIDRLDPGSEFITYAGPVPYEELHSRYSQADLCVFASSCENLPIILLEGMAAGLPIACSKRGPMPEVLKAGGLYFDPENFDDIARVLREMIEDHALRTRLAQESFAEAVTYSWHVTAMKTFEFFAGLL